VADTQNSNPTRIDVFIDFVCPWCYLAHQAVSQLQQKRAVDVQWHPFPLHPETPQEGLSISSLFGGADLAEVHARLYAIMDETGLPYSRDRSHIFNTRKAQELLLWARDQDAAEPLVAALFQAYFVDNRNLADPAVLRDAVQRAGLDADAALEALEQGSYARDVDETWQRARQSRINGVPAFIGGGYQFSGYQPLSEMERFLDYIEKG
jgi:predicted DsbA family dithiol-disulfide isomerase